MNVPSLQRLTILSLIFHITFFGAVFMAIKQSTRFVMPSSYVVSLVESDIRSEEAAGAQVVNKASEPDIPKTATKKEEAVSAKESAKASRRDERQLEEKIAAMQAKKKIARIARLRNEVKSVRGGEVVGRAVRPSATGGAREGALVNNYIAGITSAIQRQYEVTPDIVGKNLSATVFIRIMRDGSVQGARITSRSGNSTFDRCVLRAIAKASPVSPPPDGENMEVEVTFHL